MLTDISAFYPVGYIAKSTGAKGEVIIRLEIPESAISLPLRSFFILINKKPVPLSISSISFNDENTAIVLFNDYSSKDEVRQIISSEVYLPDENIKKKPSSIQDISSLKGFKVENEKKKYIGIITGFQDNKGSYLLEVKSESYSDIILIPLHEDLLKGIFPEKKIVRIIIPEGLLEI